jgi:nucleoside-diphosphate-sugar epimerase
MSHALVTGAGGYIGSILARMLPEAGRPVTAVAQCYFGRQTLPHTVYGFQDATPGLMYTKDV